MTTDKHTYENCIMRDKVERIENCTKKKLERRTFFTVFFPIILASFGFTWLVYVLVSDAQTQHGKEQTTFCNNINERFYKLEREVETQQNVTNVILDQIQETLKDIKSDTKEIKQKLNDQDHRLNRLEYDNERSN